MKSNLYVMKSISSGKYIGIDQASGGYPYETQLRLSTIFADLWEASNYRNAFKKNDAWGIFKITIEAFPTQGVELSKLIQKQIT